MIRRVEALRDAGILSFDVDLATAAMGFVASASLWLIVEPGQAGWVADGRRAPGPAPVTIPAEPGQPHPYRVRPG